MLEEHAVYVIYSDTPSDIYANIWISINKPDFVTGLPGDKNKVNISVDFSQKRNDSL
jgi:hypothetical protein